MPSAATLERQTQAVELVSAGMTYAEVARQLQTPRPHLGRGV
jgi:hypothetical protein